MILKAPLPLLTTSLAPYFSSVNTVFTILPYLPNFTEIFFYLCLTSQSLSHLYFIFLCRIFHTRYTEYILDVTGRTVTRYSSGCISAQISHIRAVNNPLQFLLPRTDKPQFMAQPLRCRIIRMHQNPHLLKTKFLPAV